jgi:hypothetical protein
MSPSKRYLPLLLTLFIGSGCAALIYEVVWFQLLQLVIGSSALSLGVLLGTYMGGMCLGSLLLPRYVTAREHPLRVYAMIEAGIGVCGILSLFGVPLIDHIYAAVAGQGAWGIVLRAVVSAVCLIPPTLLMGASLPAIARWVENTSKDGSDFSMAGTSPAQSSDVCSPDSICFVFTTCRRRRGSRWRSMRQSPWPHFGSHASQTMRRARMPLRRLPPARAQCTSPLRFRGCARWARK